MVPTACCLLYATFPDRESALRSARQLVEGHLAACCNLLPDIASVYFWQGAVQEHAEVGLLIKTTETMAEAATAAVLAHHPYETPAVLQWPLTGGSADYLRWIAATVLPTESGTE